MLPVRKSPRLEGCDYTQAGAYFVTICTHQRMHLLGRVLAEGMAINAWGQVAQACWEAIRCLRIHTGDFINDPAFERIYEPLAGDNALNTQRNPAIWFTQLAVFIYCPIQGTKQPKFGVFCFFKPLCTYLCQPQL